MKLIYNIASLSYKPMILTNNFELPEPLVLAAKADHHKTAGDISVTQLIGPPQIRILKNQHANIEQDISELMWAIMGSGIHAVIERAGITDVEQLHFHRTIEVLEAKKNFFTKEGNEKAVASIDGTIKFLSAYVNKFYPQTESRYVFEKTLTIQVYDKLLSGTFDLYDKQAKTLYDYKTCNVWAYIYPESKKSWKAQMNIYAHMLRQHGYEVKECKIVAIFRDWSAAASVRSHDYPKSSIMTIPIEVADDKKVSDFIHKRMSLHIQAEGGNVQECNGEERWATTDQWAVVPVGSVKAKRVFESEEEAETYIKDNGFRFLKGLKIEYRPGENKNCDRYCAVRSVCPQIKRINESKPTTKIETENPLENE